MKKLSSKRSLVYHAWVTLSATLAGFAMGTALGVALAERLPKATYRQLEPTSEGQDDVFDALRAEVEAARHVVIATVARPAAWRTFGLAEREQRFVRQRTTAHPVTLAVLGDARGLEGYDAARAAVVAYSDEAPAQRALLDALVN